MENLTQLPNIRESLAQKLRLFRILREKVRIWGYGGCVAPTIPPNPGTSTLIPRDPKLNTIGITCYDELISIGSVEAVLKIGESDQTTCYNILYALEAPSVVSAGTLLQKKNANNSKMNLMRQA